MDFLKPKRKGNDFLSGFPPLSFTVSSNRNLETLRGRLSLKKLKSQGRAVEVTVNSKEENSSDFSLYVVPEFGHSGCT
jgi:hypothetical protein